MRTGSRPQSLIPVSGECTGISPSVSEPSGVWAEDGPQT